MLGPIHGIGFLIELFLTIARRGRAALGLVVPGDRRRDAGTARRADRAREGLPGAARAARHLAAARPTHETAGADGC